MSFTTFIQVSGRKLMTGKLTFLHAIISRNLLKAVYIFYSIRNIILLKVYVFKPENKKSCFKWIALSFNRFKMAK